MGDLTDERLAKIEKALCPWNSRDEEWSDIDAMVAEIRRHRAMVNRLEAWAAELDASPEPHNVGHFIADELRKRMGGDHG
jgi:hypothetical protein